MVLKKISILITTKNRQEDIILTLSKIYYILQDENVECVVFDDGSTDGTHKVIQNRFPKVKLYRNETSKGYLFCRNKMLNETNSEYAISLDDDAHFITKNPIEKIENYFSENPKCGVIAFRIFWGVSELKSEFTTNITKVVKGFVGCGHAWNLKAWRDIPNYPEWYQFYGEENFAAMQLFKNNWKVHYLPNILVQHRVDLKNRVLVDNDFAYRYRRSLRADWFNYFLFYPLIKIPKKIAYSIWMQFKHKIFKGYFKVLTPLILAIFDVFWQSPKIIKNRNPLTQKQYEDYMKLKQTKLFWNSENEK